MKSISSLDASRSNQFQALTSAELSSVAGGNTIAILGVPFLIGCVIGDALWGEGKMSAQQWFDTYVKG